MPSWIPIFAFAPCATKISSPKFIICPASDKNGPLGFIDSKKEPALWSKPLCLSAIQNSFLSVNIAELKSVFSRLNSPEDK